MRGFAASLVFLNHFGLLFSSSFSLSAPVLLFFRTLSDLSLGSSLFFLISAYYTYRNFDSTSAEPVTRFLTRRLRRLMPFYWVILCAYVVATIVLGVEGKLPVGSVQIFLAVITNLTLVAPFLGQSPIVTVSWTLSYIVLIYLIVPVVAIAINRFRVRRAARIAVPLGFGVVWYVASYLYHPLSFTGVMIAAGMLLWEVQKSDAFVGLIESLGDTGTMALLGAGVAAQLAAMHTNLLGGTTIRHLTGSVIFLTGMSAFCASRFSVAQLPLNRIFRMTAPQWLGNISYSWYLGHGLVLLPARYVLKAAGGNVREPWVFFLLLAAFYVVSIVFSALLYRLCEAPLAAALASAPAVRRDLRGTGAAPPAALMNTRA